MTSRDFTYDGLTFLMRVLLCTLTCRSAGWLSGSSYDMTVLFLLLQVGSICKTNHQELFMNVLDAFLGERHIELNLEDDMIKFHCL